MDAFIAFVLCISCAAFVSCGSESNTGSTKYTAQIVNAQTNVSVTCSEPFTLKCTMKPSNASCVWSRNGTVVKQDDKRYSFNSTIDDPDCLVCFISVHEATDIDRGNWTCGIQASDSHDGIKSNNITVDVRPVSGTQCIGTGSKIEDDGKKNTSAAGNKDAQMMYLFIGIVISSAIILILISIIVYIQCGKRKTKKGQQQQTTNTPMNLINNPAVNHGPPKSDANNIYQNVVETSKTEKRFFIDMENKNGDTSPAEVIYSQVVLERVGSTIHPSEIERTEYASLRIKKHNSMFYEK